MTAGDLISDDWQFELRDYLFGSGQPVGVVSVQGLEDLPEVRVADVARARAHGSVPGPQHTGDRVILIEVDAARTTTGTLRDTVNAWAAATALGDVEVPLVWQLPGTGKRRAMVRVRRRELPVDRRFGYGFARGRIQLVATDPRVYDNTESVGSTAVGAVTGGLGFPHGFPHGFGTATAGTIDVTNGGNTPAPWTATLVGPLTHPRITLVDGDGDLELGAFTLAAGDTLELDSLNRTVLLNGTASRYGELTRRSWFDLPVGDPIIQLTASSGTGTLEVRWRSAWL